MTRVLVTGGLGFIGSHTVDALIETGYDVTVIDNLERQVHLGKIPHFKNKKVNYIEGDIRHRKTWLNAFKGIDYIIHLAGAVGIGQSFWQARKYMDVNAGATATMFEILLKNSDISKKIKKITVASSKSIYGEGAYRCKNHGVFYPLPRSVEQLGKGIWEILCPKCAEVSDPEPVPEEKPPQNLNPYSLSKYATEKLALDYSDILQIPTVALRYFNVYGPRQSLSNPYTGVVAIFLSRLKNNKPPYIFEDGQQKRDYIFVSDVANVNRLSLERGSGSYNVGTGKPTSLLQVVENLSSELSSSVQPEISGEFRPGDNRHDFANVTRLKHDFGISDFISFKKGINELIMESAETEARDYFDRQERERKRYLSKNKT
jgi:dTDP-L-rhamnose 4-epimerase